MVPAYVVADRPGAGRKAGPAGEGAGPGVSRIIGGPDGVLPMDTHTLSEGHHAI